MRLCSAEIRSKEVGHEGTRKKAAEIAETAEEPWGIELTGCLSGEG
jgi:hypothetical protein